MNSFIGTERGYEANRKCRVDLRLAALIIFCFLFAGCWQKSLHPFYLPGDLAADAKLAGTWQEVKTGDDEPPRWIFTNTGKARYHLAIRDKDGNGPEYIAHLFKLGNQRFLDLLSRERPGSAIPAHHLLRVDELGDKFTIAVLSREYIAEWLKAHPKDLAHIRYPDPDKPDAREEDELVLVADTKALQSFLLDHIEEPKLFSDPGTFIRSQAK